MFGSDTCTLQLANVARKLPSVSFVRQHTSITCIRATSRLRLIFFLAKRLALVSESMHDNTKLLMTIVCTHSYGTTTGGFNINTCSASIMLRKSSFAAFRVLLAFS